MTLLSLIVRSFRARPGRALLTLGSVIIGVAGVVSVGLAMTTTRGAYQKMYDSLAGRAALEVRAAVGGSFPDISAQLAQVPDVAAAVPAIGRPTILYCRQHRAQALAMGIDPVLDRKVHDYDLLAGEFFSDGDGVLLESSFARSLDVQLHDDIKILTRRGLKSIRVVGLLAPRGVASFSQGAAVFLPLPLAQRLFAAKDQVDSVQIVLEPGAKEPLVQQEIAETLPAGLMVRPPTTRTQLAEETLRTAEQALRVAGALSLVLATFIIINTFLMSVSERRKQWATLRAIGATRRQVIRLLMGEGFVLGTVGTALGILAGVGGAYLLTRAMERLLQTGLPSVQMTWEPPLVGAVLGVIVSLAATYVPAHRAGKISPLEGLRSISKYESEPTPLWVTAAGVLVLAIGAALVVTTARGVLEEGWMVTAGVIGLVGCVLLLPVTLGPASTAIVAALKFVLPVEAQLAQRQVLRRRVRTTLTAAVLFVAISTGIGLGTTILDNTRDVHNWLRRTVVGDFFVRAMMPDTATGTAADLPDSLRADIEKIPGVTSVASVCFLRAQAAGKDVLIIVKQFFPDEQLPMDLKIGENDEVLRLLIDGEVVIATVLAQKTGLTVGDEIQIETPKGKQQVRIAGVTNEYAGGGMAVYMAREPAERLMGVNGVNTYVIKARPDDLPDVETALRTLCDREGLMLQSLASYHRLINGMMTGVVGGLWVLLALGFLVASFGIVNTLTMNVLEQTRELALLRAVAMTRRQMRRMIICQAVIIGLIGLVPGTLAGAVMAYLMNTGTLPIIGRPINFDINPPVLVLTFFSAFVMVLIAALTPAVRASRLNVISALKQEQRARAAGRFERCKARARRWRGSVLTALAGPRSSRIANQPDRQEGALGRALGAKGTSMMSELP